MSSATRLIAAWSPEAHTDSHAGQPAPSGVEHQVLQGPVLDPKFIEAETPRLVWLLPERQDYTFVCALHRDSAVRYKRQLVSAGRLWELGFPAAAQTNHPRVGRL